MEKKHTQGPWKRDDRGRVENNVTIHEILADNYVKGSDGELHNAKKTIANFAAYEFRECWQSEVEANINLCVAAPDLLEALEYVQRTISQSEAWWMDCPNKGGFDSEIIDKAINKAYGITN
jgi:hypothetical protein